jgi:hypothetical protein
MSIQSHIPIAFVEQPFRLPWPHSWGHVRGRQES